MTSRQARSARERQHAEQRDVAAVEAHLLGQPLGVEPPALVEAARLDVEVPAVAREVQGLRGGQLQVVAGHRLVEGQGLVLEPEPLLRVAGLQAVRARPAAVDRGRPVVGHRRALGVDRVDLLDHARRDVVVREPVVLRLLGALQRPLGDVDDLGAGAESQRRV